MCCEHDSLCCAGTNYIETLRMQIHANCRIRRVYFSDRLYTEDELPTEFKCALCDIPWSASLRLSRISMRAGILFLLHRYQE